jgi:Na+-translocating ferredoxin:NAD+ oxidoreductase RnfD subunit
MKSSIFWIITPCSLLIANRCFGGKCRFNLQLALLATCFMLISYLVATCSSWTFVDFKSTTHRYIQNIHITIVNISSKDNSGTYKRIMKLFTLESRELKMNNVRYFSVLSSIGRDLVIGRFTVQGILLNVYYLWFILQHCQWSIYLPIYLSIHTPIYGCTALWTLAAFSVS